MCSRRRCGVDHWQGADVDVGDITAVGKSIARCIGDTGDQSGLKRSFIDGRLSVLPSRDGVGQGSGVASA